MNSLKEYLEKLNIEIYFSSMKPFKKNYKKVLNKYKKEEWKNIYNIWKIVRRRYKNQ